MINVTSTSTRVSQRIASARARRRAVIADRPVTVQRRPSLGETLAVGLGCDRW